MLIQGLSYSRIYKEKMKASHMQWGRPWVAMDKTS